MGWMEMRREHRGLHKIAAKVADRVIYMLGCELLCTNEN